MVDVVEEVLADHFGRPARQVHKGEGALDALSVDGAVLPDF